MVQVSRNITVKGEGRNNHAVSVISSDPIGLFGSNGQAASCDGFLAFPVEGLGKEYYTVSSYGSSTDVTEFAVVAVTDATRLVITAPVIITFERLTHPANTPFTITMEKHDVIQIQSTQDLSGSFIQSNKVVSVFAGNKDTRVPASPTTTKKSHLTGTMPPLHSLGKIFYVVPMPNT